MFECSLFSTVTFIKDIDYKLRILKFKKKEYRRTETVYKSGNSKLIISEVDGLRKIIIRDKPEPNKKQETLCRKINTTNIIDGSADLLLDIGYEVCEVFELNVIEYIFETICVEFIVRDNENKYLVNLFTLTNNPDDGEKTIGRICESLKGLVEFKKPPHGWFVFD